MEGVHAEVRRTLPAMLHEVVMGRDEAHCRTDVHDEQGRRVLTATIVMVIDCAEEAIAGSQVLATHGVPEGV